MAGILEVPGDQTSAPQVWQGHPPVPGWSTPMYRVGRKGINLVKPLDQLELEEASRMVNLVSRYGAAPRVRPGQGALATTAGVERITGLYRLNDPGASTFTRLVGSAANLFRGQSGALANVDTGYSGDPLTFAGLTVPLAGTPYAVIADRSRQRKINRTGAIETFGIAPAVLTSTALGSYIRKDICLFKASDASEAVAWTYTAGQDRGGGGAPSAPTGIDVILGDGRNAIEVTTVPNTSTGPYDSIISIARTLDLSELDGSTDASDDDLMHIQFNVSDPQYLEEIKIYLVCSAFTAGSIPGNSVNNGNAWFKAFRPNDFTAFHERQESSIEASQQLQTNTLLQDFKTASNVASPTSNVTAGTQELERLVQPDIPAGRNVWGEYAVIGLPLRRGDFARVGMDESSSPTWDTVTGIVIVLQTSAPQPIVFQFADWFIFGGYGPDVTDADAEPYDYRVINYLPATGSRGNPSAVQADTAKVRPQRAPVTITPAASGIAAMRQQAYRRGGGALSTQDWYFVGQNTSDGGAITDTLNDDEVLLESTLEIDNDQPVTSVDSAGATVLNKTMPVYFVVSDYMFALGDTNQPGRLYRSKKADMESWPATEYEDVCPTSDELMNGGEYASSGFVFSRRRLYSILLNTLDGTWTTEPTACAEGLVGRWAFCVTPFGLAFVSPFGVRLTQGGEATDISSFAIGPLFRGETVRGLSPVDLTVPTALRLEYFDFELWLTYQDSGGTRRHLIFNFMDKTWRPYLFGTPVSVVYNEPVQGAAASLLLGSNAAGAVYTHSGHADAGGTAIAYQLRTGAWAYGNPRIEKLLSEVIVDGQLQTATLTMTPYLNDENTVITPQTAVGIAGQRRYYFEPFGTVPTHARNVAIDLAGNAPTGAALEINAVGVTIQEQPEITYKQPTPWEELPGGEGYCFGMMLTCDTAGIEKAIRVEYTVNNGAVTAAADLTVVASGRRKLPFTWPAVLAHQIRLRPTEECEPWMRFKIEWLTDREPPRIQGWDTNWQTFGSLADKWLKGILIEADTFGAIKDVEIDIDQVNGAVAFSITQNGRGIQQFSFAKQRGRVFRLRSTDSGYGKLYQWQPIFDEEPLALSRWESEERPFPGMDGRWQKPLDAWVCVRSTADVTWQIDAYGQGATALNTSTYTLPSTAGEKRKLRVPLQAVKGLLFSHLFTSDEAFWLYREESEVYIEDFNTGQAKWCPLFLANDDLDPARAMGNPVVAAATPGGA